MKKQRTISDLWQMPGWTRVDNDTAQHAATGVTVERIGMTPRPWYVLDARGRVSGPYRHATSAIDRALDEVHDRT